MTARNLAALAAERAILARAAADVAAADAAAQARNLTSRSSVLAFGVQLLAAIISRRNLSQSATPSTLRAHLWQRPIHEELSAVDLLRDLQRFGLILLLVRRMLRLPQAEAGSRFARRRSGSQQLFLARSP